jgi:putative ABC transport system permease protein
MRKSGFYPKLALTNILRNGQFYLPYFLTCTGTVAMFYIMCFLTLNDMIGKMPGGGDLRIILNLGCIVIAVFSAVILLYTNSFVMKRRRRELGLYNILGLEKRHIARLLCCEGFLLGGGSIAAGLACGILLSKLLLLLLLKLLKFKVQMGFSVSGEGMLWTIILFAAIFLMTLIVNLLRTHLSRPVELLYSDSVGEREPKTKRLLTAVGVLSLAAGYCIANMVRSPLSALALFFLAVMLVILGTYCLFTAGSIALLKRLRANPSYYYQPRHFTAVSGLLYRMKQNAVGLASICILSTMVLVTVSTTVCLYLGTEQVMKERYPTDLAVTVVPDSESGADRTADAVSRSVDASGCTVLTTSDYSFLAFPAQLSGNNLILDGGSGSEDALHLLICMTADTYAHLSGESVSLRADELACYDSGTPLPADFWLGGSEYHIARRLEEPPMKSCYTSFASNAQILVTADDAALQTLNDAQSAAYGDSAGKLTYETDLNLNGTDEEKTACAAAVRSALSGEGAQVTCRQEMSAQFYAIYGGFLFLGLFLGLLFLMVTALIIYYKQISEGYDDRRRFEIMQKVGMSAQEVRRSVQGQILLVFFLPLAAAGIHILAAFHMITRLLALFSLTDVRLFALCTLGTLACFAVLYALVYWATARTYYQIVRGGGC